VELIFAGELWVVAHGPSVPVEIKAVFILNDDGLIVQVFATVLGDGGLFLVPVRVSGVDVEAVEVEMSAGCPCVVACDVI